MRFSQLAVFALSISPLRAVADSSPSGSDSLVVRAHYERAAPAASPSDSSASATASAPAPSNTESSDSSSDSSSNSSSGSSSPTDSSDNSSNTATDGPTKTGSSKSSSQTGKSSGKSSDKGKNSTATDDGSDDAEPTHTSFNVLDPAAAVVMQTPVTNVPIGTALYKIGDYISFGWNYTNLQGTPTAIDVLVTCSSMTSLWTLTSNMTFQTSVNFVWDTQEQAEDINKPLLTNTYTLIIKDSDVGITARPEPGYLGSFSTFTFGLYKKQPYVPYNEYKCLDCNGGPGGFDSGALRLALTMGAVSVLSFTWFTGGLGLI